MTLSRLHEDAATAVIFYNPIDPGEVECHSIEPGVVFFDWLKGQYPHGFGRPIRLLRNYEEVPLEEMDFKVTKEDVISVVVCPAGDPLTIALISAAISAVASLAATLVVYLIFGKPKKPKDNANPEPVYSLQGGQNMIRLGEPVPCPYGRVITYPDAVTMPYAFFDHNDQFIDQILCIGHGEYEIEDLMIGDTPGSTLAPGVLQWREWKPSDHLSQMGTITRATGIEENMVTSIEVSDQEFPGGTGGTSTLFPTTANITGAFAMTITGAKPASIDYGTMIFFETTSPNTGLLVYANTYNFSTGELTTIGDAMSTESGVDISLYVADIPSGTQAGPFICSNVGFNGTMVQVDFVFPNGIYAIKKDGSFENTSVAFDVITQQIDDNNDPIGSPIVNSFVEGGASNATMRITRNMLFASGRYSVKVVRTTPPPPSNKVQNNFVWTGLKFKLDNVLTPVYGGVTLISVRMKATNGISSDAANKIRVIATRKLNRLGNGPFIPTRSPVDAFIDVVTNTTYGLGRPLEVVDVEGLVALEDHWGPEYALFDAIFNVKTTVWEALTIILQGVVAVPVRAGRKIGAVSDGCKVAPAQLFSDANIVEDTFQASYDFDRPGEYKGIQVEYRDPINFQPAYAQYPAAAVDLDNVTLFGCTTKHIAEEYARLMWQKKQRLRQFCNFDTELEGFIPLVGSRVLVSTDAVAWGDSGEVIAAIDSHTLLLDRTVDFTKYAAPVIVLRGEDGTPTAKLPFSGTTNDRVIYLIEPIPLDIIPITDNRRATQWAIGDFFRRVKDFTIQSVTHTGDNTTQVSAVIYDERVYEGTLPFLMVPI